MKRFCMDIYGIYFNSEVSVCFVFMPKILLVEDV